MSGAQPRCAARYCERPRDPASYYGRCTEHMWCARCGTREAYKAGRCNACLAYIRRRGRERPIELIRLADRRDRLR